MIPHAAIFDMDGLMVETESLSSQAYYEVLSKHGVTPKIQPSGLVHEIGVIGNLVNLKKRYNVRGSFRQLRLELRRTRKNLIKQGVQAMPGIFTLLDLLDKKQIPMAIASGSLPSDIRLIVNQLGIRRRFQFLLSGTKVARHKPAPDIYLEAARKLKVEPYACLVFEDSNPGIVAAKSAGMHAIAVPSQFTACDDFSSANLVMQSLEHVTWELILSL